MVGVTLWDLLIAFLPLWVVQGTVALVAIAFVLFSIFGLTALIKSATSRGE